MFSKKVRNTLLLFITATIWGTAFVAQSEGGQAVGPYTFNCIRSFIGAAVLLPLIFLGKNSFLEQKNEEKAGTRKQLWIGGVCCGIALMLASNVQQLGLYYDASPGKAGFLTACYILIVPVMGLFLKKHCGINVWIGVFLALMGLYFLCCKEETFSLTVADVLLLLCAFIFSIHILLIDFYSPLVSGVQLACIQFFVCGVLTAIPMVLVDLPKMGLEQWIQGFFTADAWVTLLFGGVMSCGVAYTLQIIGQEGLNPTIASMIMSLESVISVLAGWILINDSLSRREIMGCIIIFTAIILAQLPEKMFLRKEKLLHKGQKFIG